MTLTLRASARTIQSSKQYFAMRLGTGSAEKLFWSLSLALIAIISAACTPRSAPDSSRLTPTAAPQVVTPSTSASPTAAPKLVTLVMCASGDAVRLDPADFDDNQTAARADQIFETLVEFDGETTNVRPALAESWSTTPDGKEWTMKLRRNVKFHDDTPFNADAVIWNFARQWNPKHPYHTKEYSTLDWEYWHDVIGWGFKGEKDILMQDIVKVNDYTVKFVLADLSGPFLTNLALFSNAIASPTSFEKFKTDASNNPVGTGPFRFVTWIKNDRIILEKNKFWWGGKEKILIDRLIFRVMKDNSDRFQALKSGECHGIEGANSDDVRNAKSDTSLQVINRPPLDVGYVAFNQAIKPLDNLKVRQAIAFSINKKTLVDSFYAGNGMPATQFLPPSIWGYNPDIKQTCCDPDKARQLLKEAGLEKGFSIDFWYMPISRPYFPTKSIGETIAKDLAQVGIIANLKTEDWEKYKVDARDGKFAMWMLGWTGDNGDPDNFLTTIFGDDPPGKGANTKCCGYYNKQLNDLLVRAARLTDPRAREILYKQSASLIDADMARIPIAHSTVPLIFSKKVSGYIANPTGTEFFKTVKLEP